MRARLPPPRAQAEFPPTRAVRGRTARGSPGSPSQPAAAVGWGRGDGSARGVRLGRQRALCCPPLQMVKKTKTMMKKAQRKMNRSGRKGEADRHVFDMKPKHLLSGKRKAGKKDRR